MTGEARFVAVPAAAKPPESEFPFEQNKPGCPNSLELPVPDLYDDDMKMLRAREVAERLRVRVETVCRHARSGKIPAVRVGGQWRFPEDRLEAWLRGNGNAARHGDATPPDPSEDPILKVIGIGSDGALTRGIDRALYGRRS